MGEADRDVRYQDIPNFPGYRAGSDGSILSCWPRGPQGCSPLTNPKPWYKMRLKTAKSGYLNISLRRDGRYYHSRVHRLILESFIGPCPAGMEGCHENNDRADCRLENLRWDTPKGNMAD